MPEKIFIGVAWPYSNGSLHIGQIVGAYLPADVFARYHRAAGNDVLMVSGSDLHGTPITVRAEQEGRTPADVASQFHNEFLDSWERLGISWDLYTTTGTENHARVVQDMFLRLLDKGDIYQASMKLPYCVVEKRFLLDRYVEGTCPICGDANARGDQCDNCGNVVIEQGLHDRAITRDLEWGIPIPVEGYSEKRIYVWFENVIGYLSAAIELAEQNSQPERWRDFWQDSQAKSYYFIGKDNIWFHTLSWPAQLMGYSTAIGEDYNLPYDVPANQYLTIRGSKASTSRRMAVWVPDFLSRYDPDPLRYYLVATMPESSDSDFTWTDFVRRNNDELVATWGNLVNRVLNFAYRNFAAVVPKPGELTDDDRSLVARSQQAIAEAGQNIALCHFRAGLESAMSVAREANRYVEENAPWKLINEDRERCATVLHTAIGAISGLNVALSPYLPFTCETIHGYLGNETPLRDAGWRLQAPPAGRPLSEPQPLFKKLDPAIVEKEEARLGS